MLVQLSFFGFQSPTSRRRCSTFAVQALREWKPITGWSWNGLNCHVELLTSRRWGWVKTLVPIVNPKIAGKWMFIPLKCIYRYWPIPRFVSLWIMNEESKIASLATNCCALYTRFILNIFQTLGSWFVSIWWLKSTWANSKFSRFAKTC